MKNYSSVKYQKNFIQQVIFRIDFLEFVKSAEIFDKNILDDILSHFPFSRINQVVKFNNIDININATSPISPPNISTQYEEGIQREFTMENEANRLILSNKFLIVDFRKYTTFEEMHNSFKKTIDVIFEKNKITVTRTGIRYINIFDPTKMKIQKNFFSGVIASAFSTALSSELINAHLVRSITLAEYVVNEMRLNFRYGVYNKAYPNPVKSTDFVLDFDCFTTEPFHLPDEINKTIILGHDSIQSLFEDSISDKLREIMKDG